MIISTINMP